MKAQILESLIRGFRQLSPLLRITTTIGMVGALIGISRFLYDFGFQLRATRQFLRFRFPNKGIYVGFWTLPNAPRVIWEVVEVKRTLSGFKLARVCAPSKVGTYALKAVRQSSNEHVFHAIWKKQGNTIYKGSAILKYHEDNSLLVGKWLGPDKTGIVRGGNWYLRRADAKNSVYSFISLSMRLSPLFEACEAILPRKSVLTNVIQNHKNFQGDTIDVKGVKIKLSHGTFNPMCGVLSIPLLEKIQGHVLKGMEVLDLGTGSGFHAIYLAKNVGCKCTGVDISQELVSLANFNSTENGTSGLTTFIKCNEKDIYSWAAWEQEFDIIIANLPFSTVRNTYRSRKSAYYRSFRGSRRLLLQVILGSLWHIKPEGKLFLGFGESGYVRLFERLIDISPWKSGQIWDKKGLLDHTCIKMLELNPGLRKQVDSL